MVGPNKPGLFIEILSFVYFLKFEPETTAYVDEENKKLRKNLIPTLDHFQNFETS